MKSNILRAVLSVSLCSIAFSAPAIPSPSWFTSGVIYQISLRTFTRGGDFRSAEKMLEHIRDIGANIVYLTPFVEMDRDMDRAGWSPRQIKSGYETPKNPYRISDYNKVDPEYGTDEDVKSFVNKAHALGLKVMFDLVYLHAGPNNVIAKEIPDAFQRNPDGSIKMTQWRFPYINYESKGAREYLIRSMERFVREFDVDGFRCDVGDGVPEEFWNEAFTRVRAIKSDFATLNEGEKPEYVKRAFNANYNWNWSYAMREAVENNPNHCPLAKRIFRQREYFEKCPSDALIVAFLENHDIATDDWSKRLDSKLPVEAVNAAFAGIFLTRTIPVIWNGNEIADGSKTSFFGPVEHPMRIAETVNWEKMAEPKAAKRMSALRELAALRRNDPAIGLGTMTFLENDRSDRVLTFLREVPGTRRLVAINLSGEAIEVKVSNRSLKLKAWEWKVLSDEERSADTVSRVTVEGEEPSFLPSGRDFKLIWNDEFNGTKLDESKWSYRTNFWGRRFRAFAAPEQNAVEVADGKVHLKLVQNEDGTYAAPQLQTGELLWDAPIEERSDRFWYIGKRQPPKFEHKYGYYECRCRLQQQKGWWSAFWMQTITQGASLDPARSGIEHDIMESFEPGEVIPACFHYNGYGDEYRGFKSGSEPLGVDKAEYHTFGMLWEPDGYTLFVDGRQRGAKVGTGPGEAVSQVPEFILISTEPKWYRNNRMTGEGVSELKDAFLAKDEFIVDFVRVYDIR